MTKDTQNEKKKILLGKLEKEVRESGDDTLTIKPFFDRILRSLDTCSTASLAETYNLSQSFLGEVLVWKRKENEC
jgi:hypothetical protein